MTDDVKLNGNPPGDPYVCLHASPGNPCRGPVTVGFALGGIHRYVCDHHLSVEKKIRQEAAKLAAGAPVLWDNAPNYEELRREGKEFMKRWAAERGFPEEPEPRCSREGSAGPCWGNLRSRAPGSPATCSGHREPDGPYRAEKVYVPGPPHVRYLPRRAAEITPELEALNWEIEQEPHE